MIGPREVRGPAVISRRPRAQTQSITTRCDDGCPPAPVRAAEPGAQRCRPAPGRCACPRAGDRRSRRRARGAGAALLPGGRRCAPGRGPAPPRAAAGTGRARAASTCGPGRSFRPEHLDTPCIRDANVNRVERRKRVTLAGLAVALERDWVTRACEVRFTAV